MTMLALVLYMEVLTLDDSYEAAYQGIISIYVKEQDYEKIKMILHLVWRTRLC